MADRPVGAGSCIVILAGLLGGTPIVADEPERAAADRGAGFESAEPGPVREVATDVGTFVAEPGHAEIDAAHARTGKQCLHLLGGDGRAIELRPTYGEQPPAFLTFHAERWTRRAPFTFRVEFRQGDEWSAVYNGDAEIRIGGFLTHVTIPLADRPERIRFVCSSPPKSGILLDDFTLVPATKQRITAVTVQDHVVPVLAGTKGTPILRVRVDVTGTLDPLEIRRIDTSLDGHTGLASVRVLAPTASNRLDDAGTFGEPQRAGHANRFEDRHTLRHGANDFWVVVDAEGRVDLDHVFTAGCRRLVTADGTTIEPVHEERPTHRYGVAVRVGGQDGVHTSRIPGLATTRKGTLIAVYDLRHRGGGDLPGDIDVGMSRSTDGGTTWEPTKTIIDMGDDPEFRYDGVGDPCILVDRETGTIWVAGVWSHGNRGWSGSQPGTTPEETGQFILVRSDDDGRTWSKPINITRQIKRPEWAFLLQGPGKGITMQDGTLVFPAQYQDALANRRLPHATIVFSRDHGRTWQVGTGAFPDTTEAQVVEREPGELMLNARYNRESRRVVMTTRDMGRTWTEHGTSRKDLIEPRACMASLVDVDRELGLEHSGRLLFSNPNNLHARSRITIKASPDGGETWSTGERLDDGLGSGYSCMSIVNESTVGILYEGSRAHMTYQRLPLSEFFGRHAPNTPSRNGFDGEGRP